MWVLFLFKLWFLIGVDVYFLFVLSETTLGAPLTYNVKEEDGVRPIDFK